MRLLSDLMKGKYVVLKDRERVAEIDKSWKSYTCFSTDDFKKMFVTESRLDIQYLRFSLARVMMTSLISNAGKRSSLMATSTPDYQSAHRTLSQRDANEFMIVNHESRRTVLRISVEHGTNST